MGFEALLGNRQLKDNLISSLRRGRASHFYLISGPAGSGKHTLARLLAAALQCEDPQAPCGVCHACRKVLSGNHPDYITVEDPEHKKVAVKIVRQIRDDMFIRPNEGKKKIYLFPQELGIEGQNALLKILEEPPGYGVFILLAENAEQLLTTVRSRSVELKLLPLEEETLRRELSRRYPEKDEQTLAAAISRSGGFLGQAMEFLSEDSLQSAQTEQFIRGYGEKNSLLLTTTLVSMERWKRDQLVQELQQWLRILGNAQLCRNGMAAAAPGARELAAARSGRELYTAIETIDKAIDYALKNVSPAAICGWLVWALR
jgi:DNA polymerase-3 subunit delta'